MSNNRPVILSYDAISPIGTDLDSAWQKAENGESGIGSLSRFPLREKFPVNVSGEIDEIDVSDYPFLKPRELAHWSSPIFKHALLSVHRAVQNSGLEITKEIAPGVATTYSTAIGGLDAVLAADRLIVERNRLPNPFVNPNSCVNMVSGKVSILTGATGPIMTTITACATGNTSMITGAMLIASGQADVAICGAVDFPLVEPIVAGFATMNGAYKIKPNVSETPDKASRPFSKDRRGFVVSEGAGSIIIASKEFADAHGLSYEIELAGWGMTSDAKHFVAPNQKTVTKAMKLAISHAGITTNEIDAINAHAASTKVGDQTEYNSLVDVFGSDIPPISANKSQIGHAMGASSAIESIFAIEGMKRGKILPTINYNPDDEIALDLNTEKAKDLKQEFLLKNAFGFGGCNACIVFRNIG